MYFLLLLARQKLTINSSWYISARLSFWLMCSLYANVFKLVIVILKFALIKFPLFFSCFSSSSLNIFRIIFMFFSLKTCLLPPFLIFSFDNMTMVFLKILTQVYSLKECMVQNLNIFFLVRNCAIRQIWGYWFQKWE